MEGRIKVRVEQKTWYQTPDGQEFESETEAVEHIIKERVTPLIITYRGQRDKDFWCNSEVVDFIIRHFDQLAEISDCVNHGDGYEEIK